MLNLNQQLVPRRLLKMQPAAEVVLVHVVDEEGMRVALRPRLPTSLTQK